MEKKATASLFMVADLCNGVVLREWGKNSKGRHAKMHQKDRLSCYRVVTFRPATRKVLRHETNQPP